MSPPKFLFENDRVRVSDMRLSRNGDSIRQTLQHPTVRWQVDEGIQCQNESNSIVIPDKAVFFDEPQSICEIENGGDSEFRQIWFEIKQEPRRTEEDTKELLENAIYSTDVGTELLFENRYCRVWDFYYEPGGGDPSKPHHHVLDYVFVYVAKGRLLGYTHDGKPGLFDSINEDGDVTWFHLPDGAEKDPACAHGGKNGYGDIPMREYLVELK
jgi:hypothetical protein